MSVISKENKKALAELIDGWTKFKNPLLEGADGFVYSMAIGALDDNFLTKIKPEFHERIDQAVGAFAEEDYDTASEIVGEILAEAIDTPLIDGTEEEEQLYVQLLKTIENLIKMLILNKK